MSLLALLLSLDHFNEGPLHRLLLPTQLPFTSLCVAVFILSSFANDRLSVSTIISRAFIFLGSLTYSLYMVHYPVQLAIAIVNEKWIALDFLDPLVWSMYFSSIFVIAIVVHRYFEVPARSYLRRLPTSKGDHR